MSEASKTINLYPLPADDMLNVSLNNSFTGTFKIVIYDLTGNTVYFDDKAELIESKDLSISINHLKSGIYIFKLIALNKREIIIQQFVKA
ncbi:T9SS type A sorting domain-containing protein [Carboxylicivirga marina]|uniref:T9SS type A sorting domain-containing protein n=1 Tax=Carboxylicivirga marina TaxID=2800988 RepID=A0ABS1HL03_9BACT|nr:T9SS type A sorting domain-containing protein [Carboxylicivirga marina]MBK3518285.1 T9SS type A sorting domain-containing protein [Carboxylicivirga marina]